MDHHTHVHPGRPGSADVSKLGAALGLILGFMAAEVVAGFLASSLALLSDAAHMLTDAGAIGLALVAAPLARPPAPAPPGAPRPPPPPRGAPGGAGARPPGGGGGGAPPPGPPPPRGARHGR